MYRRKFQTTTFQETFCCIAWYLPTKFGFFIFSADLITYNYNNNEGFCRFIISVKA